MWPRSVLEWYSLFFVLGLSCTFAKLWNLFQNLVQRLPGFWGAIQVRAPRILILMIVFRRICIIMTKVNQSEQTSLIQSESKFSDDMWTWETHILPILLTAPIHAHCFSLFRFRAGGSLFYLLCYHFFFSNNSHIVFLSRGRLSGSGHWRSAISHG